MPFDVPESLLQLLRDRREQQRHVRAARAGMKQDAPNQGSNFIDSVRELFADGADVDAVAQSYVVTMNSWHDEIEVQHDAFLLYPGMGPMLYLTADGRILQDSRGWDGDSVVEVFGYDANAALLLGAKITGIRELLNLLPPPPPGAAVCTKCNGTRMAAQIEGSSHEFPCIACEARGWKLPDASRDS